MLGLQGRRGIKESQDKPAHRVLMAPLEKKANEVTKGCQDHQDCRVPLDFQD